MQKNIVVCSDGTGNSSIKGRGTNVFKLFEAMDLGGHRMDANLTPQVAFYDDGVGTETFKPLKIFAGITGYGLSRNVKQLYKEVVRLYDPGDAIYMFGFSRGAFTVRTLAGFIATCGLLDREALRTTAALDAAVAEAYRVYRSSYRTKLAQLFLGKPDRTKGQEFRARRCRDGDLRIRFIGVWDTVDAVGLPFHLADVLNSVVYRFKFPDHRLSASVDQAAHALAVDDERHSFHPLLWDETAETGGRIEQVWFAGAHSNVGGGYPKQGMSLVALDWLMAAAERAGLRFVQSDRRLARDHANVDDKLYDPRAGLGVFYRWKPRDIAAICQTNNLVPKLHLSVLERAAHGTQDYAPGNLPPTAKVVVTPPSLPGQAALLEERARRTEAVLREAQSGPTLLSRVRTPRVVGQVSYYVYLAACLMALVAAAASGDVSSVFDARVFFWRFVATIGGILTNPLQNGIGLAGRLLADPKLLGALAGGFVVAYVMTFFAERRMRAVFSAFWHQVQPRLRAALKQARTTVAENLPSSRR